MPKFSIITQKGAEDRPLVKIMGRGFLLRDIEHLIGNSIRNPDALCVELSDFWATYICTNLQEHKLPKYDIPKPYEELREQEEAKKEILGNLKGRYMDSTDKILTEREKTHGNFEDHAHITDAIKKIMRGQDSYNHKLTPAMRETLDMTAHKIGRILAGDPFVRDHWDDIAGYARLAAKGLK